MMYEGAGHPGADIAVVGGDQTTLARARYLGYMRRSMPPRCSPVSIVIIVLALGMLFIGLVFTVIANWPGATTIGENPLRIAGPVLLAVGGVTVIIGIAFAGLWNQRERSKWEKSITDLAAQRSVGVSAQPLVGGAYPYSDQASSEGQRKSILRTSRGSAAEDNAGYYEESGKGAYPVDGLPEAQRHADEAADIVPDPVRVRKSRSSAAADRSGVGSSSGSEIGAADLGSIGVYSPPTRNGRQNGGYSNGAYMPQDIQRGQGGEDDWRRPRRTGREDNQPPPTYDQLMGAGQQGEQQHLRVHIRAQPGTAVTITPSITPPRGTPTHNVSRGSRGYPSTAARQLDDSAAETEI